MIQANSTMKEARKEIEEKFPEHLEAFNLIYAAFATSGIEAALSGKTPNANKTVDSLVSAFSKGKLPHNISNALRNDEFISIVTKMINNIHALFTSDPTKLNKSEEEIRQILSGFLDISIMDHEERFE